MKEADFRLVLKSGTILRLKRHTPAIVAMKYTIKKKHIMLLYFVAVSYLGKLSGSITPILIIEAQTN